MNPNPTMKSVSSPSSKKTPRSSTPKSSQKSRTKSSRNPVLPTHDRIREMFTTDPDKIRAYIQAGPSHYHIDPEIILVINIQANKLSADDFNLYTDNLPGKHMTMMRQFQAILADYSVIHEILGKPYMFEDDYTQLINWMMGNHEDYRRLYLGDEDYVYQGKYTVFPPGDLIPV